MEIMMGVLLGVFLGWMANDKLNECYVMLLKALSSRAVNVIVLPEHARVDRELREGQPYVEIILSCHHCHRKEMFRFTEAPGLLANAYQCPHCSRISPLDPDLGRHIAEALAPKKAEA